MIIPFHILLALFSLADFIIYSSTHFRPQKSLLIPIFFDLNSLPQLRHFTINESVHQRLCYHLNLGESYQNDKFNITNNKNHNFS